MSASYADKRADKPTRVKICGITNLEDALVAVEAGADYLGFIFYRPSKRCISPDGAQEIVATIRSRAGTSTLLVGVFVNEPAAKMAQVLAKCDLDLAQLSGDETPDLIGDPDSPIYGRSYKAIRPASFEEGQAEAEWYIPETRNPDQPSLLIDSQHTKLYGGTGQKGDWSLSARLAQTIPGLMLAGGLRAGNVAAAIQQVHPFAVDVASGVEVTPGKKDHTLVRSFIDNVRSVYSTNQEDNAL